MSTSQAIINAIGPTAIMEAGAGQVKRSPSSVEMSVYRDAGESASIIVEQAAASDHRFHVYGFVDGACVAASAHATTSSLSTAFRHVHDGVRSYTP